MKVPDNRKNWSEFQWERAFRKDEDRIHYYFMELPRFIDLPDEEEIILKKMKLNPELVSQNDNWDDIAPSMFYDDLDDDIFLSDDWVQKDSAKIYMQLAKLASQWNIIWASELDAKHYLPGLHITCLYGRALAYTAELLDVHAEDMPGFTLCVGKRLHAEINRIIGRLGTLVREQQELRDQIVSFINHLQSLREKLLDLLAKNRNPKGKEDKEGK